MPPDDGLPRQQYSFADFTRTHPRDGVPGDRLDDEFTEQRRAIGVLRASVAQLVRSDGRLANAVVGVAQVTPDFVEHLSGEIKRSVAADAARAKACFEATLDTAQRVKADARLVSQALMEVDRALIRLDASTSPMVHALTELKRDGEQLLARIDARTQDVLNDEKDAAGWGAYAYDWAQVSWRWAEWMDGPIPSDILAIMGITGAHWSSAWWANEANRIVSEMGTEIPYDNTGTGLAATNVQDAIDELAAEKLDDAPSDGTLYGRENDTWTPVPAGLPEAPAGGLSYVRRGSDHSWQVATSGGGGADAMMRGVATSVAVNTACVVGTRYRVTSNVTMTLPVMAAADALVIERDTTLGSVTIARNGQNIDGVAADFTFDIDKQSLLLTCTSTGNVATRLIGALPTPASLGNTELLMHMEGANGGAVFTDSSNYARAVALVGSPTTTNAQFKVGATSAVFNAGAANTWLDLGSQITLGTTFTIEFWMWKSGTLTCSYLGTNTNPNANGISMYMAGSGFFTAAYGNGTAVNWSAGTSTWHYYSLQRDANNLWSFYRDGVLQSPQVTLGGVIDCSALRIGGAVTLGTSGKCNGGIDELRISNIARYSGTYTPPTAPWTPD
jgi:hypothetical protein